MNKTARMIFGRQPPGLSKATQVEGETLAFPVEATLDLGTVTVAVDTVLKAVDGSGADGNAITIALVHDAGAPSAGALTRVGTAFTFTFLGGTTKVADFEAAVGALAGDDALIEVASAGTGGNTLTSTDDQLAATALSGGVTGANDLRRVITPSTHADGYGGWSVHLMVAGTPTGSIKFYYSNLPDPDPGTSSHWVEDSTKAITLSGTAVNTVAFGMDKPVDNVMVEVTLSSGAGTIVGWAR